MIILNKDLQQLKTRERLATHVHEVRTNAMNAIRSVHDMNWQSGWRIIIIKANWWGEEITEDEEEQIPGFGLSSLLIL